MVASLSNRAMSLLRVLFSASATVSLSALSESQARHPPNKASRNIPPAIILPHKSANVRMTTPIDLCISHRVLHLLKPKHKPMGWRGFSNKTPKKYSTLNRQGQTGKPEHARSRAQNLSEQSTAVLFVLNLRRQSLRIAFQ